MKYVRIYHTLLEANWLDKKVVGTFVSELKVNFNDILAKSKEIITQVDKNFNQQLFYFSTHMATLPELNISH
jgi:hypothetical protein